MFCLRGAVPLKNLQKDLGASGGHSVSVRWLLPSLQSGAHSIWLLQRACKLAVQAPYSFPMIILLNVFQMSWRTARLQAKCFGVVFWKGGLFLLPALILNTRAKHQPYEAVSLKPLSTSDASLQPTSLYNCRGLFNLPGSYIISLLFSFCLWSCFVGCLLKFQQP